MGLGDMAKKAWDATGGKIFGDEGLLDTVTGGAQVEADEIKEMGQAFQEMQYDPNLANFAINDAEAQKANNSAAAAAAANSQAPQGTAATMQAAQGTNATVNSAQSDQARAQIQNLLNQLQNPTGPSAAQIQLQRGNDAAIAAQRAQAASARGMAPAIANKIAATNIADITAKGAADASLLKAQEDQARQGLLAQTLQGMRGQDIEIASQNAAMEQQTLLQNAGFSQEEAIKNAEMAQQMALANLQAGMTWEQITNEMVKHYTSLNLSLDQANLAARMALEQLMAQQAMATMNASAGIVSQNAASQQQAAGALIGAGGTAAGIAMMSSGPTKKNIKEADVASFLDDVLAAPSIGGDPIVSGKAGALEKPTIGAPKIGPGKRVEGAKPDGLSNEQVGKALIMAGQNYAKMMSDEDQKKNITPAKLEKFMAALKGKTFEYKDGETFGEGERLGIIAQDVQKGGPIGEGLVTEDKDGNLMIAMGDQGLGAVLASLGNLHDRIKEIESRQEARKKKKSGGKK